MAAVVLIVTSDDNELRIPEHIAKMSGTLKSTIEELGADARIPIPVDSETFAVVVKYCEYIERNPLDPKKFFTNVLEPWEVTFFNEIGAREQNMDLVFKLIQAANYLCIKSLLDMSCKFTARFVKPIATDLEAIRKFFKITEPFTEDELAEMREEDKWAIQ